MVLRRKRGEAILLADNIRLIILDVKNGKNVRFGIEAPMDVPVHRLEIFELIQAENHAASSGDITSWVKRREHD